MKVVRGTPKHLSKTGELNDFTYLMLNLEFGCNYHCPKCFNQGKDAPKYPAKDILILEDRLGLIKQAKELGAKAVVIAGEGEPSIHKDIRAIISETNARKMIPIIYSNGAQLTRDKAEFYKENNVVIIISLDSLNPERYDILTGTKNQLETVLKNIKAIREIYKESIIKKSGLTILGFAINTTVSSLNRDEVAKIKEFCGEDIYFICNPLASLGSATENWGKLMKTGEKVEDFSELIKQMSETGGPLMLGSNGLCNYSSSGIAISPYGHYMTCAYTNLTNELLGNVRNKTLKDAYEHKHKMEAKHYSKFGGANCLVRADSFAKYISQLKETGLLAKPR